MKIDLEYIKQNKKIVITIASTAIVVLLLLLVLFTGHTRNDKTIVYYAAPDLTYRQVRHQLDSLGAKPSGMAYCVFSKLVGGHPHQGRYEIPQHVRVYTLVRKIARGREDPLQLTLKKYRTKDQLSAYLGKKLMCDSSQFLAALSNSALIDSLSLGVDTNTVLALFVPNTYEVYWTTTPAKLLTRMKQESDRFWTSERQSKAKAEGLTPTQVMILASIVEEETNKDDEKPLIASVYLNRLRKGMLLQADPTVKYAVGDFGLKRIMFKHTSVQSPYNTYRVHGLPIGPICTPSVASIDAVLENRQTDYIFFCAKADMSGRHAFAATAAQHAANAAAFHKALNARGI